MRQENSARDFASEKANFPQEYFVYFKGNWRISGTKDRLKSAVALRGFVVKKSRTRNRHFSLPLIRLSLLRTTRPPSTFGIIAQGRGDVNSLLPNRKQPQSRETAAVSLGYGYIGKWKREFSLQRMRIISRSADILLSAESRRSRIISGANFRLIFTSIPIIQLKMNFVNE